MGAEIRKNCQNVFELLEVRATEVLQFQREKNSDEGQFHNAMINNWCPGQWSLEVKNISNP